MPALGREQERKQLGLNGRPYCSGLGYLLNARSVKAIGPNTMECLKNSASNHSDTEVGRCVLKNANTHCTSESSFLFKQVYYQQDGDKVFGMKLVKGGQMKITFPQEPKGVHFSAGLLHPLKRAEDFYRFHKQSVSWLRPVQPQISKEISEEIPYRSAVSELRNTCVNNALRQLEKSSFYLKECPSPKATEDPTVPSEAYIMTRDLPGSAGERSFEDTRAVLAKNEINSIKVPVPGWKAERDDHGQIRTNYRAYLQKMQETFQRAVTSGVRRLFLLEDKVIFLCDFKAQFWQLLSNARCADHLFTEHQGGVLLLGAEEVTPDSTCNTAYCYAA